MLKPLLPGLIELYFKFWNNLCTSSWFAVGVAAVDIANKGKRATWFGELSSDFSFDGRLEVLLLTVNTSSVILPACFITGLGDGTTVRNFVWPLSDESRFSASLIKHELNDFDDRRHIRSQYSEYIKLTHPEPPYLLFQLKK